MNQHCSHEFRDSKTCVRCGDHVSDVAVLTYAPPGLACPDHLREHVLRIVDRMGEPQTAAARQRLAELRAQQGKEKAT